MTTANETYAAAQQSVIDAHDVLALALKVGSADAITAARTALSTAITTRDALSNQNKSAKDASGTFRVRLTNGSPTDSTWPDTSGHGGVGV